MAPSDKQKCVMIIAGEASGDLHGAHLVRAMRKRMPTGLFFCGIGGRALEAAGVRILMDAAELSVVGITEVFEKLPQIFKGLTLAKRLLKSLRPELLILIDFPDFNFRVAAAAKKMAVPVLYYISPQLWAWRPGRAKKIRALVDKMAVILPFEADFFKQHGVPVVYVGHPLLDNRLPPVDQVLEAKKGAAPVLGLLPGSRPREISVHLPIMLRSAAILKRRYPEMAVVVSSAGSVDRKLVERIIESQSPRQDVKIVTGEVRQVLEKCHVVIAVSGTVTLEVAIYGVPMVIIYKVSPITYWLGRALVRVNHIGLANLVADKRMVPELMQHQASPEEIADSVGRMLNDPDRFQQVQQELLDLRNVLGGAGASGRVADLALEMLHGV